MRRLPRAAAATEEKPLAPETAAETANTEETGEDFRPHSKLFTTPAQGEPESAEMPDMSDLEESLATVASADEPEETLDPAAQAARMPRVEDFPPVARAEIEAREQDAVTSNDERGPMGLLKRLTHGLARREDEEETAELRPAQQARQPC